MQRLNGFLILVVNVCSFVSYLPQIVKLLRTKKSEDIAVSTWILWMISGLCYLLYTLGVGDIGLILTCVVQFVLDSTVTFLSWKYRHGPKGGNSDGTF